MSTKKTIFRKTTHTVISKDLYNQFISKYTKYKDVDYKRFINTLFSFNDSLCDAVYNNANGVELPTKLGTILLAMCESKKQGINFGILRKTGEKVFFDNSATDNKMAKIFFLNRTIHAMTMKGIWNFKASDSFRSMFNKYKKDFNRYIQLDTKQKIYHLFADLDNGLMSEGNRKNLVLEDDYNEFKELI